MKKQFVIINKGKGVLKITPSNLNEVEQPLTEIEALYDYVNNQDGEVLLNSKAYTNNSLITINTNITELEDKITLLELPNEILTLGAVVLVDNTIKILPYAFTVRINQKRLSNPLAYSVPINPTTIGYNRIDIITIDSFGIFTKLQGEESLSTAIKPQPLADTLEVTSINITGNVISPPVVTDTAKLDRGGYTGGSAMTLYQEITALDEAITTRIDDIVYEVVEISLPLKEDKNQKGVANGYVPLNEFTKIALQYLNVVNNLVDGGTDALLTAEQGKQLQLQVSGIQNILFSDNVNLDTVQEIVDALETVQSYIATILVNDLTTGGTTKALTAEMGKSLKGLIDNLVTNKEDKTNKQNSLAVDGTNTKYPTVTAVNTGLALKANLASPTFTGIPLVPTATAGTNTTQIATTAFVTGAISTADSGNVKLTGDQTISGQKSFSLTGKIDMQTNNAFPAILATSLGSNGRTAAEFINNSSSPYSKALRLQTSLSGGVGNMALDVSNQSSIGTGIVSNASNGGVSISSQSGNGDSYTSNITSGGTGRNYVGRNNGVETYSVDKIGNVIGNSYIKRSTPANNILLAGGGDLAQNTAFNKNFGTTAGTVVEGNDSRFTDSRNPLPNSSNYIQNQNASAQTANMWISGSAKIGTNMFAENIIGLNYSSGSSSGKINLFGGATNKGGEIILSGGNVDGNIVFKTGNGEGSQPTALTLNADQSATFSSRVTATSYTATSLPVFENNASASSLSVGQFYRTSTGVLMVKF